MIVESPCKVLETLAYEIHTLSNGVQAECEYPLLGGRKFNFTANYCRACIAGHRPKLHRHLIYLTPSGEPNLARLGSFKELSKGFYYELRIVPSAAGPYMGEIAGYKLVTHKSLPLTQEENGWVAAADKKLRKTYRPMVQFMADAFPGRRRKPGFRTLDTEWHTG